MARKALEAAIALSRLSKCRQRHGAVLMKNGQVIAASTNIMISPATDANWRRASIHAEEAVLRIAGTAAHGAVLYVARTNRSGEPGLSLPCPRCRRKIIRAKVNRVVTT